MKSLYFVAILLVVLFHSNGQEDEALTMVFSSKGQVYIGKSDKLHEAKKFKNFKRYVTSFAKYNDYLYASVKRSHWSTKDSSIWRAKLIVNSTNTEIDDKSWINFDFVNKSKEDIRCMTIAKGYIYAGRSDGIMRRCSTDEPINCTTFNQFDFGDIIGIDYNPGEEKIYAALLSGTVKRCSPDTANSCEDMKLPVEFIMAFKIEFNTLWLDVTKETGNSGNWLLKCPISTTAAEFKKNCRLIEKHLKREFVKSIQATSSYLYLNFWNQTDIYSRDPNISSSSLYAFSVPKNVTDQLDTFIIV